MKVTGEHFMPNVLYFILTCAAGLVIAVCIVYKKRRYYPISTLILFFLFTTGIAWISEFIVLGFFDAYKYKTGIFTSVWAQNVLGHLLINSSLYPAFALVVGVYSLKSYKIAFISVSFVAIEYLFSCLGIYEQHWWRYYMTLILVFLYLLFSKYWFARMLRTPRGFTRAFTFYPAALVLSHFYSAVLSLLDKEQYRIGWVNQLAGDKYWASALITFPIHLFFDSVIVVLFLCILHKWYWKITAFIISGAALYVFYSANILVIEDKWNFVYTLMINYAFIGILILLEKYALRPEEQELLRE